LGHECDAVGFKSEVLWFNVTSKPYKFEDIKLYWDMFSMDYCCECADYGEEQEVDLEGDDETATDLKTDSVGQADEDNEAEDSGMYDGDEGDE
jgi:hypothetical protein